MKSEKLGALPSCYITLQDSDQYSPGSHTVSHAIFPAGVSH